MGVVGVFSFRLDGAPFDKGLGGRLAARFSLRGGCGKEFMLTVFRTVLAPAPTVETARGWGRAVVGAGVAGGKKVVVEGARRPLLGVLGAVLPTGVETLPVLLRVFPTGSAGRAALGGPLDGRDALGSAVAISNYDPAVAGEKRKP